MKRFEARWFRHPSARTLRNEPRRDTKSTATCLDIDDGSGCAQPDVAVAFLRIGKRNDSRHRGDRPKGQRQSNLYQRPRTVSRRCRGSRTVTA